MEKCFVLLYNHIGDKNMFSDTHCHIFKEYYNIEKVMDELDDVINVIINNAVDYKTSLEVLELSNKFDKMYCAIGLHPQENFDDLDKIIKLIKDNLDNKKLVAIGEIGLDYYNSVNSKEDQIKVFESQLKLAEEYNIPVIIHSRESTKDTLEILKKYKVKGIIHCFNGSFEIGKEYIKMGFFLGINGIITFKNCKLINTLSKLGLEKIVFETDSPYLTPEPNRGKTNIPNNIRYIISYISKELNIEPSLIINKSEQNIMSILTKNY